MARRKIQWVMCGCGMRLPLKLKCPVCESDGEVKKVGIAIDSHKLKVFSRELTRDGFPFTCSTKEKGAIVMVVHTAAVEKLRQTVERCQRLHRRDMSERN